MNSSTLEEILSGRKKVVNKLKEINEEFFSLPSNRKTLFEIEIENKLKEISGFSDSLMLQYLQIVKASSYHHYKVKYPENLHQLYTLLDVKNSDTLDKIMKLLSKYNLSPFYIEESAKEFVEKITGKDLSKIISELETVIDLIEEDDEIFSAVDFKDSKKTNHIKKFLKLIGKFEKQDLEHYAELHTNIGRIVKSNGKYKHIIKHFLYKLIDSEDNLEEKFSALQFSLDVCKDNKNFISDFEMFFKAHLVCGDKKIRGWYDVFVKSADSRLKPVLSYFREVVNSRTELDLEPVLQDTADMLSLYSLNEYMINTINEKTRNRHIKVKCGEINSLLSIIKTIESEAMERKETAERIQECVREVVNNFLKEESTQHRIRSSEIFKKYHKEVSSKFKNGNEYIDSISQLFSSQKNLLSLSNEALTAVYSEIESNKKISKRKSKKDIVKEVLENLGEDKSSINNSNKETLLSQTHKTLEIYANMIAGRNYSVRIEGNAEIGMKYEQDNNSLVICLPSVINTFKEEEKNNILFRALATMLAGHARYSSGKSKDGNFVNISDVSQTFENPDLYKFILQVIEVHRIKYHLSQEYPGFKEDLSSIVQYFSKFLVEQVAFSHSEQEDNKKILRQLVTQSLYETGENRNEKIDEFLNLLESEKSCFEDSLNSSKRIYALIKNPNKLALKSEEKKFAIASIEQVVLSLEQVKPFISETKSATVQFTYPEFDFRKDCLVENAVSVILTSPSIPKFIPKLFADFDKSTIAFIKEQLEHLKPSEKDRIYGSYGTLDMEKFQNWKAQRTAGVGALANDIFVRPVYNVRNVATAITIEHSGSTKRFVGEQKHKTFVADYMKRLTQHLIEFMSDLGDDVALYAYQGVGAHNVQCTSLLDFGEEFSLEAYKSLAALESKGNNRDGAIIRHIGSRLSQHSANTRVLLNITDGVPHDEGYEGEYAFADVKMACRELERSGIIPIRLIVDPTLDENQIKSFEDEYTLVLANFNEALKKLPFLYYDKTK